jgi:uncharacterized membrane protein
MPSSRNKTSGSQSAPTKTSTKSKPAKTSTDAKKPTATTSRKDWKKLYFKAQDGGAELLEQIKSLKQQLKAANTQAEVNHNVAERRRGAYTAYKATHANRNEIFAAIITLGVVLIVTALVVGVTIGLSLKG